MKLNGDGMNYMAQMRWSGLNYEMLLYLFLGFSFMKQIMTKLQESEILNYLPNFLLAFSF